MSRDTAIVTTCLVGVLVSLVGSGLVAALLFVLISALIILGRGSSSDDCEVRAAAEALSLEGIYILQDPTSGAWVAFEVGHPAEIARRATYNRAVLAAFHLLSRR